MESDRSEAAENRTFAACVSYVRAHFCEPELSMDTVCRVGYISASGLQRAFHAQLGLSPKQYLIKLRMNRAPELLAERTRSVKEVAFLCGFNDEKYFSGAFRQRYGYPPSRLAGNMTV